jgi:hypothetical protein
MINRRFMIVPPALASGGHAEQLEGQVKKISRLQLEAANMRECPSAPPTSLSSQETKECRSECTVPTRTSLPGGLQRPSLTWISQTRAGQGGEPGHQRVF